MLIGAKQAGFKIVGNIEWREYYHTGTFEHNFKNAYMDRTIDESGIPLDIDLVMGHPECGNYSNLRTKKKLSDPGDIPLFMDLVKAVQPRFFVQDNLPKSLIGCSIVDWMNRFPEYDLFPEWVSNYHYGNSQLHRKRFFMIGALKSERFTFQPGEFDHVTHLRDVIKGLTPRRDNRAINHVHRRNTDIVWGMPTRFFDQIKNEPELTLALFKQVIKDYPSRKNFVYRNKKGEMKVKIGYHKVPLDHTCYTLSGGGPTAPDNHYRDDTLNPLTMRERARIQGCPDNFIFQPLDFIDDFHTYQALYKQTGKFMPVEFNRYVAKQIAAHIKGKPFKSTGQRLIKPNEYVDEAKQTYCDLYGYRGQRQKTICQACWIKTCERRHKP